MTQIILVNRVYFVGFSGLNYIHIKIDNCLSISVCTLSRKQALDLVESQNLVLESDLNYEDYNSYLGYIYTDGQFKDFVNSHPQLKSNLIKTISHYEKI